MMTKTSLKTIRSIPAVDARTLDEHTLYDIALHAEKLMYSTGACGRNGLLVKDNRDEKLYKVTARCSELFILG